MVVNGVCRETDLLRLRRVRMGHLRVRHRINQARFRASFTLVPKSGRRQRQLGGVVAGGGVWQSSVAV